MKYANVFGLCLMYLSMSNYSYADLPLTIDDLTTDKNRFKLETNLNYFNQNQKSLTDNGFNTIDLGNGRIINIPNNTSETTTNTDSLILGLGLRYGITNKWDIGLKTNIISHHQRYQTLNQNQTKNYQKLQDVIVTSQYQLIDNHPKLPNTLIFGELSVYDNTPELKTRNFSSILTGATIYTINDPIVLSLTGTYQYHQDRTLQNNQAKIDMGDILSLNGLVGFAINPDITLTGGVGWQLKDADKIYGLGEVETKKTQTSINLGLAYALSERSNITTSVRTNISGNHGSTISIGLTTKLGKLPEPLSQKYRKLKQNTE